MHQRVVTEIQPISNTHALEGAHAPRQSESPVVVVLSGSMEPAFQRSDILYLDNTKPHPDIGDIVVYKIKDRDIPIVHRVLEKHKRATDGHEVYLTKGDNINYGDRGLYLDGQMWIERTDVVGIARASVPYAGMLTILLNDIPMAKCILIGGMGLFVLTQREQHPRHGYTYDFQQHSRILRHVCCANVANQNARCMSLVSFPNQSHPSTPLAASTMDATAAKKLIKKQERLKKKVKAAARKQTKHSEAPGLNSGVSLSTAAAQPPPAAKKAKSHDGPKPSVVHKPVDVGFEYEGNEKFLTPAHPQFQKLLVASYQGFVHEPAATIDAAFHKAAKRAFETLRDKSYFQYDVVMAGGKNLSRTFVRRTLVGEPGITYKYLGLRIFAHSWSGPTGVAPWFKAIHALNTQMTARTQRAMQKASNPMGSCAYNLTLINYMEPLTNWDLGLKDDETYGLGKTSVSWHADSSLQDFSAIGVYNCMLTDPHKKKKTSAKGKKRKAFGDDADAHEKDWRIALRLAPEPVTENGKPKKRTPSASGVKAVKSVKALPPAVSMATRDGDAYYLLGDFNHAHQHMVLTGSSVRVSTTHRVAVESDSTLASILARLAAAYDLSSVPFVDGSDSVRLLTPQYVLKEQSAQTELEMEWIRQYWIQGKQHDVLHIDWQKPMRELERVHWRRLETRTRHCVDLVLLENGETDRADAQGVCWQLSDRLKIVNVLLQELAQRQKRRGLFRQRIQDKAYRRIASEFQPVERPSFDAATSAMPYDLAPQLQLLETLKAKLKK